MRLDIVATADRTVLSRQGASVTLYKTGSPRDLIVGTLGLTTYDLTPLVASLEQTSAGASLRLVHHNELSGANRPQPGQLVQIKIGADVLANLVVDQVSSERVGPRGGERSMSVALRRRDATTWWRDVHRVSPVFGVATDLGVMARVVLEDLGLTPEEYDMINTGVFLAHTNAQLADLTAWDMLETTLQPALMEPWVDALGVVKSILRTVDREADLALAWDQVLELSAGASKSSVTSVRVKWLNPDLTKVTQQEQVLANAQLMIGFFRPWSKQEVWWSEDHRQRAENTRMVVKQSINDGLIFVGRERYYQSSDVGGYLKGTLGYFDPLLATLGLLGIIGSSYVPDLLVVEGIGAGHTIPLGRIVEQASSTAVLYAIMTMGFGIYEIWGVPYDFVHVVDEVEAYDQNAPDWSQQVDEVSNDLVPNEEAASALAVAEFLYRCKSAKGAANLVMVDDLRVERGDIIALPDGRRLYVLDFNRSLTRGADAVLNVEGFWATA